MPSPLFRVNLRRHRGHECDREIARTVGPPRLDPEPGLARPRARTGSRRNFELISTRSGSPSSNATSSSRRADRDGVRLPRAEADVHPLVLRIPARLVGEAPLVERRVELAVDGGERVADERLGHASAVVVRRLEARDVLDEVEADEERVVSVERAGERREEPRALLGVEVPDRASEEGDQARGRPREARRDRARSRRRSPRRARAGRRAAIACALARRVCSLTSSGTKRSSVPRRRARRGGGGVLRGPRRRARRASAPACASRSRPPVRAGSRPRAAAGSTPAAA